MVANKNFRLWKIAKSLWNSIYSLDFNDKNYQKSKQIEAHQDMQNLENILDLTIEELNITEDDYIVCEYVTSRSDDFLFMTPLEQKKESSSVEQLGHVNGNIDVDMNDEYQEQNT